MYKIPLTVPHLCVLGQLRRLQSNILFKKWQVPFISPVPTTHYLIKIWEVFWLHEVIYI